MTDLFLGLIAAAVLVMATIQVGVVVFAARAARRVGRAVERLESDVRPIMANLQAISAEAARATAVAAGQVERADRVFTDLSKRVEETLASLQHSVLQPAREAAAVLHGIRAALAVFREPFEGSRKRSAPVEEEDALFIG